MEYGKIGTVSHGTLRTNDLLETFADTLEDLIQRNAETWCNDDGRALRDKYVSIVCDARELCEAIESDDAHESAIEDAEYLLNEKLMDALNDFAPPYCTFSAHEGDGSDFGFWPSWEYIKESRYSEELASGEELPCACCTEHDEFLQVNERGNATLYKRQQLANHYKWIEVWSCV